MPKISSDWAKALEPNIDAWVHEGFAQHPDTTSQVFAINDEFAGGIIRLHDSWGAGIVSKSSEGAATPEAAKQKGYETVLSPQIFKQKFAVTFEDVKRNLYPQINADARDLGKSAIYTLNLFGASVITQGFNTSYTAYGDGKPLFSIDHTRPDGGTAQSNASSTGITLTESNLETGINALRQQKSGKGVKLAVGAQNIALIVPEALEKEAVIITGSQLRSGTGNNDLNWYLGKFNVLVHPFIGSDISDLDGNAGSDTAWILKDMSVENLRLTYETRPFFKSWEDENTDVLYTKIYFSCEAYFANWVGLWGSKGDGAAYSD